MLAEHERKKEKNAIKQMLALHSQITLPYQLIGVPRAFAGVVCQRSRGLGVCRDNPFGLSSNVHPSRGETVKQGGGPFYAVRFRIAFYVSDSSPGGPFASSRVTWGRPYLPGQAVPIVLRPGGAGPGQHSDLLKQVS